MTARNVYSPHHHLEGRASFSEWHGTPGASPPLDLLRISSRAQRRPGADALPATRGAVAVRQLHRRNAGARCVCVHVELCLGLLEGAVNFANAVSVSPFGARVARHNSPAGITHMLLCFQVLPGDTSPPCSLRRMLPCTCNYPAPPPGLPT